MSHRLAVQPTPDDLPTFLPTGPPIDDLPSVLPAPPAGDEMLTVLPASSAPVAEAILIAEPVSARRFGPLRLLGAGWRLLCSTAEWLFGAVALIGGLAVLASIPVVQLLSFGYLLEVCGRVARTGRLRDGFIGIRPAARIGSIVTGIWLTLLPLKLVSSLALDAQLIDPNGPVARNWRAGLGVLTVLLVLHITAACSRGGKLRYFFWPFGNPFWLIRRLRRGGYYVEARDAVWRFISALRLPYYFWLGLRGFFGTMIWLVIPVSLLAAGTTIPRVGFLLGFPGAFLLMVVLLYLPFLQARFAAENRFAALFEVRAVRQAFRRAPWAFGFSFLITLLFAVPLYLLKIEMIPREATWLPGLVFLTFIFPARLLTGWAYSRAQRRTTPRHWFVRWTGRLAMLPVVVFYVIIIFFTQYISWGGIWSLYEQHAFLLPVPFAGM
jgi:hypothetical protein